MSDFFLIVVVVAEEVVLKKKCIPQSVKHRGFVCLRMHVCIIHKSFKNLADTHYETW